MHRLSDYIFAQAYQSKKFTKVSKKYCLITHIDL
nr:MAG TPA: protein of unknown function DUF1940 [Caudoviricetes sp.]